MCRQSIFIEQRRLKLLGLGKQKVFPDFIAMLLFRAHFPLSQPYLHRYFHYGYSKKKVRYMNISILVKEQIFIAAYQTGVNKTGINTNLLFIVFFFLANTAQTPYW